MLGAARTQAVAAVVSVVRHTKRLVLWPHCKLPMWPYFDVYCVIVLRTVHTDALDTAG
jgi:hypothetical protein